MFCLNKLYPSLLWSGCIRLPATDTRSLKVISDIPLVIPQPCNGHIFISFGFLLLFVFHFIKDLTIFKRKLLQKKRNCNIPHQIPNSWQRRNFLRTSRCPLHYSTRQTLNCPLELLHSPILSGSVRNAHQAPTRIKAIPQLHWSHFELDSHRWYLAGTYTTAEFPLDRAATGSLTLVYPLCSL